MAARAPESNKRAWAHSLLAVRLLSRSTDQAKEAVLVVLRSLLYKKFLFELNAQYDIINILKNVY